MEVSPGDSRPSSLESCGVTLGLPRSGDAPVHEALHVVMAVGVDRHRSIQLEGEDRADGREQRLDLGRRAVEPHRQPAGLAEAHRERHGEHVGLGRAALPLAPGDALGVLRDQRVEGVVDGDRQFERGVDRREQGRDLGTAAREASALVGERPSAVIAGDLLGLEHALHVLVDLEQRHRRRHFEQGQVVARARLDETAGEFRVRDPDREPECGDRDPGETLDVAVPDALLREVHADPGGEEQHVGVEERGRVEMLGRSAARDLLREPLRAGGGLEAQLQAVLDDQIGNAHRFGLSHLPEIRRDIRAVA
ncbi:hypothetical protein CRE_11635 [Caenorhabditis remanei]|uniref:Uncharacterized protein n=1 Tax=Caenorhabditis remanei TaxID=31234 RepID=E3NVD2_CAERE|nr:hypothetical protein CRE_11635 [Caenorhabditis remanei]